MQAFHLVFVSWAPGTMELVVIFLVILVLFGPKKLPEIARMIGKTIDQLRHASQDFKDEIMKIEDDVKKEIRTVAAGDLEVSEPQQEKLAQNSTSEEDPSDEEYSGDVDLHSDAPGLNADEEGGQTVDDIKEIAG